MSFIKYRVREVAADFGMTPKEVSEVAGKYFDKPKSNSQVLTDEQLNVIFDHITQNRQIDSLEQVFAAAKKPEPKPAKESPKAAAPVKSSPAVKAAAPAPKSDWPLTACIPCPLHGKNRLRPYGSGMNLPSSQSTFGYRFHQMQNLLEKVFRS